MDRQIIDRLHNAVSAAIRAPMSKRDALEILEELHADFEGQIEALKDEIAEEEE